MLRRLLTSTLVLLLVTPASAVASGTWRWPVRGEVLTSYRNGDDPYAAGQHRGIDIAGATGDPVIAAVGGEVRYAGALGSSGVVVSVRTADGSYDTSYLHLSSVAVARGQRVAEGDRVGAIGTSGERSATAPHVHFGVREAGQRQAYVDPLTLLGPLGAGGNSPVAAPVPDAAPAPVVAPMRVAPRGAPKPGSVTAGAPQRAWRPFRAPVVAPRGVVRTRVASGRARGQSTAALAAAPNHGVARVGGRRPAASAAAVRARRASGRVRGAERGVRRPSAGALAAPAGARATAQVPSPAAGHRSAAGEPDGSGPDLGLVLAGLSLVAAAVGLGLRGRGEDGGPRRRAYRVKRARSRPAPQP